MLKTLIIICYALNTLLSPQIVSAKEISLFSDTILKQTDLNAKLTVSNSISNDIQIISILPNPSSDDKNKSFIVISNSSSSDINLRGYKLQSSAGILLFGNTPIPRRDQASIYKINGIPLSFRNSHEVITLINSDNIEIQRLEYKKARENEILYLDFKTGLFSHRTSRFTSNNQIDDELTDTLTVTSDINNEKVKVLAKEELGEVQNMKRDNNTNSKILNNASNKNNALSNNTNSNAMIIILTLISLMFYFWLAISYKNTRSNFSCKLSEKST